MYHKFDDVDIVVFIMVIMEFIVRFVEVLVDFWQKSVFVFETGSR